MDDDREFAQQLIAKLRAEIAKIVAMPSWKAAQYLNRRRRRARVKV